MTDQSWGESPWSELGDVPPVSVPPVGVPPVGVRSGSTRLLLQGRGAWGPCALPFSTAAGQPLRSERFPEQRITSPAGDGGA